MGEAILEIDRCKAELSQVRHEYFNARTTRAKTKWRAQDAKLRARMTELLVQGAYSQKQARKLAVWDPYDQNAHAEFFDKEWMFGVTQGFEIVIGNPPYRGGREWKKEEGNDYDYFTQHYAVAEYQFDIYALFWEQGIRLAGENGLVAYITPNTWLNNQGTTKLRAFILRETRVISILDCSREDVFASAVVLPIITLLQKSSDRTESVQILEPMDGHFREVNRIHQSLWTRTS
jgi:adenine-specific DNA-methyltransferase